MAHYIQDYLYSELPDDLSTDCIMISKFKTLPAPGAEYLDLIAAVDSGTLSKPTNEYYICEQVNGEYEWVRVFDHRLPDLDFPEKPGEYLFYRDKNGKYEFVPYVAPKPQPIIPFPTKEGTYVLVVDSEGNASYKEQEEPEPPVPPTPEVPDVFACVDYTGANLVYDDEDSWTYEVPEEFDSDFPFVLNAFGVDPITSADIIINAGEGLSNLEVVSIHPSYDLELANGAYLLKLKEGKDPVEHVYVNFKMELAEFDEERTNSFEVKLTNIKAGEKDLKDSEAVREIKFVPYKEPVVEGPILLVCVDRYYEHSGKIYIDMAHNPQPVEAGITLMGSSGINDIKFNLTSLDPDFLYIEPNTTGSAPLLPENYDFMYDLPCYGIQCKDTNYSKHIGIPIIVTATATDDQLPKYGKFKLEILEAHDLLNNEFNIPGPIEVDVCAYEHGQDPPQ